jgi:hypothetical protein
MTARPFVLVRHYDPTGISGVGIIGEGVAWTGGSADLHWMTEHESFVHWPGGLPEILAVHGHNGSTVARFLDEPEAPIDAPSNHEYHPIYDPRD